MDTFLKIHTFLIKHIFQVLIEIFNDKRHIRSHNSNTLEEAMQENIQSQVSVLRTIISFKPRLIQVQVPIRQLIKISQLPLQNSIKSIILQLDVNKTKNLLCLRQNPLIQRIVKFEVALNTEQVLVVNEVSLSGFLVSVDFLKQELAHVVPRQENIFLNIVNTVIIKFQLLSSHKWRVHQVKPNRIRALLVY